MLAHIQMPFRVINSPPDFNSPTYGEIQRPPPYPTGIRLLISICAALKIDPLLEIVDSHTIVYILRFNRAKTIKAAFSISIATVISCSSGRSLGI